MMGRFSRYLHMIVFIALVLTVIFAVDANPVAARHRRRHRPSPPATPSATPTPILRPFVLITGGTGLVASPTGENPAVLSTAEVYDCVADVFLPINSMTTARDNHAAERMVNGKILIAGGIDTAFAPSIPFAGAAVPWILSSTEMFDPSVGDFKIGPQMTASRDEPTAILLKDARVLIVGGGTNSAELYDPVTNKLAVTGELTQSRYAQSATILRDGHVLIAGGGPNQTALYDPRTGTFRASANLRTNRIYHTATLLNDGTVLIAGGSPHARSSAVDSTEIYNEARGVIRPGPKMTKARAGHTATLLRDGRVLIAGGRDDNTAELFAGSRFVPTSNMNASRYAHSATLLPGGKVLIAGGWGTKYKPLASAEIYDPSTGRFAPTGDMTQPRAGHTATLIWVHWPVNWIKPTPTPTPTATPTPTITLPATPTPMVTATSPPAATVSATSAASTSTASPITSGARAMQTMTPASIASPLDAHQRAIEPTMTATPLPSQGESSGPPGNSIPSASATGSPAPTP